MRTSPLQAAKTLGLILALVSLLILTTALLLQWTSGYARSEIVNGLTAIARTSIALIDVSRISKLAGTPADAGSSDFIALRADLQRVRVSAPEVRYVYFLARKGNDFVFLVDAEPENSGSYSPPGSLLAAVDAPNTKGIRRAIESGEVTVSGPYDDRWGRWVSALTPILDAQGHTIAVLGIDVPAEHWNAVIARYREFGLMISGLFAAIVVLATGMILLQLRSTRKLEVEVARQKDLELKLRVLSQVDALTQIANRRHFDEALQIAWRRSALTHNPLALLMIDVDRFKSYNDTYGHIAGDGVLNCVAQTLSRMMRTQDVVARYGGEEFVVILGGSNEEQAFVAAERMRAEIEELSLPHVTTSIGCLTISIGVASILPTEHTEPWDLLAAADRALYQAKSRGGNGVVRQEASFA